MGKRVRRRFRKVLKTVIRIISCTGGTSTTEVITIEEGPGARNKPTRASKIKEVLKRKLHFRRPRASDSQNAATSNTESSGSRNDAQVARSQRANSKTSHNEEDRQGQTSETYKSCHSVVAGTSTGSATNKSKQARLEQEINGKTATTKVTLSCHSVEAGTSIGPASDESEHEIVAEKLQAANEPTSWHSTEAEAGTSISSVSTPSDITITSHTVEAGTSINSASTSNGLEINTDDSTVSDITLTSLCMEAGTSIGPASNKSEQEIVAEELQTASSETTCSHSTEAGTSIGPASDVSEQAEEVTIQIELNQELGTDVHEQVSFEAISCECAEAGTSIRPASDVSEQEIVEDKLVVQAELDKEPTTLQEQVCVQSSLSGVTTNVSSECTKVETSIGSASTDEEIVAEDEMTIQVLEENSDTSNQISVSSSADAVIMSSECIEAGTSTGPASYERIVTKKEQIKATDSTSEATVNCQSTEAGTSIGPVSDQLIVAEEQELVKEVTCPLLSVTEDKTAVKVERTSSEEIKSAEAFLQRQSDVDTTTWTSQTITSGLTVCEYREEADNSGESLPLTQSEIFKIQNDPELNDIVEQIHKRNLSEIENNLSFYIAKDDKFPNPNIFQFKQPLFHLGDYFVVRMAVRKISLEYCLYGQGNEFTGLVCVSNKIPQQRVFARYTLDNWETHADIPATLVHNDEASSCYMFDMPYFHPGYTQFSLCCESGNGEAWWDENSGRNYKVGLCYESYD